MTVPVVGQPYAATVTFRDGAGDPIDPARVTMTANPPGVALTPLVYGDDEEVTRIDLGIYRLTFTPDSQGRWTVLADAFDTDGSSLGTATAFLDVASPPTTITADTATSIALAVVEEELGRPLKYVTGDEYTAYTEGGRIALPMRPVQLVTGVIYATGMNEVEGALPFTWDGRFVHTTPHVWATFTYDHGWLDGEVPPIITAIVEAVATRYNIEPSGGITRETLGTTYSVDYGVTGLELTKRERELLSRYGCRKRNTTLRLGYSLAGLR